MRGKKIIAGITAVFFITAAQTGMVYGAGKTTKTNIYTNDVGSGINYSQQLLKDGTIKKLVNIVTCDLSNNGADIVFSKAKDIVKKEEVLSKQIEREVYKGNNVVAGINADMFDMGIGFSSGPQVVNGAILTNHNARSEENMYPVFGIDNNKKAFIDYIHMDAKMYLDNTTPGAINVTTNGAINAANAITIDSVNRDNCKDKLVLDNVELNQNGKVDLTPYLSRGMSSITVVKGINEPIALGKEYEGTVESVGYGSTSADIPADGVLLCSTGTKAGWINKHLKPGDKIKINVSYDRENMKQVIGAYTYFLRSGRVLTNDEMIKAGAKADLVHARKARTALGITADNKIIAITTDGGTPSKGISDGITLLEMANLLKSLGAVDGVGFDGGGSTEMNVKKYGDLVTSSVNKPSDGRERALTNGILFVSNSERSYNVANIAINGDISIFKNTSYQFKASGMDTNFNRLDLTNSPLNWKIDGSVGSIDNNGVFKAGNGSFTGHVTVGLGTASASANVKVLSTVVSLKIGDSGIVPIQTNVDRQFNLDARDGNGKSIIIDNKAGAWSVTPAIGTIDKNGLLKVTAKSGSGVVTVAIGSKKASIKVSVMQDATTIDDFEHNDAARYIVNGFIGGIGSPSSDYAKSGKYSYKISYDYDKSWDRKSNGTINVVPTYTDKNGNELTGLYTSALKPKKLSMWIYGDGQAPPLKAVLNDGDGNSRTIDVSNQINWTGWKYVEVDIPSDIPNPITFNSMYFVETNKTLHKKGDIYIDDIKYVYSEGIDLKAPAFSNFSPLKAYAGNVNINVKISDASGVKKDSIITKLDGAVVPADFDEDSGVLSYYAQNLSAGNHRFEVTAADMVGNVTNPAYASSFTVSDEKDTKAPVINNLLPSNNSVIKTATPRISVLIKDDKAGLDAGNVDINIDGTKLKAYYDESSGYAFAIPPMLSAGVHKLAVAAKDRAGNKTSLQPISFTVSPLQAPKNPDSFTISVLSDSHATEFGNDFFNKANTDSSELVIQNGDMVDSDSPSQWAEGLRQLGLIKDKPVMVSPGNHEASSGSINDFKKYLGMPTYSFEFGNSLFISLNSAIGQSITKSDPTQFEYLKQMLSSNTKKNVFVYTHVPTRDSAGIDHALPNEDVQKLESILSTYKKNNNDKTINVIFGHMHSFQSWQVNGVNYTIDGNECLKKYVSPDNGGYMGYTQFDVNGNTVTRRFIPMPKSIAVVDSSIVNGTMKLVKGETKNLSLYGDFSQYSSDYIAILNNIQGVDIKWESDNPNVASISQNGALTGVSEGEANIKVTTGDRAYTFKVVCSLQLPGMLSGLKVAAETNSLLPDLSTRVNVIGYDIYGDHFIIDSNVVNWMVTNGSIVGGVYKAPKDITTDQAITITAQYGGIIKSTDIMVVLKQKPQENKRYVKVTATSLNIRDKAAVSGAVIGKLSFGDRVEVIGDQGDWLKVNSNGKIGYISKQYTKEDQ